MNESLKRKVLQLAAQICQMHAHVAGGRICQDWNGETDTLDGLTAEERDQLSFQFEQYNSDGRDFEPGYFPYDEMVISFIVARALEVMGEIASQRVDKDVTDSVGFGSNDAEFLPLTRCVCGKKFAWWDFILGIYRDDPQRCPQCGRELYFSVSIRVYEVPTTNDVQKEVE